jgi:UDP-N-acetylglucosamine 2-epimerase (non-hydrolysing)
MSKHRTLIHIIAGARPNFMKIAPIIRAFKKHKNRFDYQLIHTGQHYDKAMSDVFFDELGIPAPDHHLEVGSGSHATQTANIMTRYESVCLEQYPDLVLVVGDVNSTLACSIVAKKLGKKVIHVEAGLRSGDMEMPEEINRIVTDSITDYFFVTEKSGIENLKAEGKPEESIFFIGNVMIDNLFYQVEKLKTIDSSQLASSEIKNKYPEYGVVTLHRPSNVDDKATLTGIIQALTEISRELPLIFPIHPRTKKTLDAFNIQLPDTIVLTEPMPYMDFLNLFKDAKVVLTDSGGIQEETTALGIPCITMRENTERPITVDEGTNVLVGSSLERIIEAVNDLADRSQSTMKLPDMWDGKAATRLLDVLMKMEKNS